MLCYKFPDPASKFHSFLLSSRVNIRNSEIMKIFVILAVLVATTCADYHADVNRAVEELDENAAAFEPFINDLEKQVSAALVLIAREFEAFQEAFINGELATYGDLGAQLAEQANELIDDDCSFYNAPWMFKAQVVDMFRESLLIFKSQEFVDLYQTNKPVVDQCFVDVAENELIDILSLVERDLTRSLGNLAFIQAEGRAFSELVGADLEQLATDYHVHRFFTDGTAARAVSISFRFFLLFLMLNFLKPNSGKTKDSNASRISATLTARELTTFWMPWRTS